MWLALLGLVAAADASEIVVNVDGAITFGLDGRWSELGDGRFSFPVAPGVHQVRVRKPRGEVYVGQVRVMPGDVTRCRWDDRQFWCEGDAVATPVHVPVSLPPVPSQVKMVFRSTDGEWADVLVDGRVVAELRNQPEAVVWTTPGRHTVEVRDFLGRAPYAVQRVDTGYADTFTFGLREGAAIVCYEHPDFVGRVGTVARPGGPVALVLRATDGDWLDVYVDGAPVAELRNAMVEPVYIAPGAHTVEVRHWITGAVTAMARLDTGRASVVTLGVAESAPVTSYDHRVDNLCVGRC